MNAEDRRAYHVGNLRARLLDEARAILEAGGLEQLNLRDLAARAGIAVASVYHHFDGKAALLCALAVIGYGELKDQLVQAAETAAEGARVRNLARAYFAFARREPALYAVMFDPRTAAAAEVARSRAAAFAVLESAIAAAVSQQGRPPETLHKIAVAVWTCTHGAAALAATDDRGEALLEDVIVGLDALFRRR